MDLYYGIAPAMFVLVAIAIAWLSIGRILRLRVATIHGWGETTKRIVLAAVAAVALIAAGSSAFNAVAVRALHPPGEWYSVDGNRMRIDCTGSGSPTIVLDAGLGNDGLIWGGVQPALGKTTRICSYDRAGFGWSDPLPPPRDADHIASELHGLLAAAKIDGPIVLMGHSISGIYIRDYATRYPADVAGLIFIDGSTPLQNRNPAFKPEFARHPLDGLGTLYRRMLFVAGIPRLSGACSRGFPNFNRAASELQAQDLCRIRWSAIDAEMDSFDRSGEQTVHTGPYGSLPILIFSQDPGKGLSNISRAWDQMHEDLKKLSTRSRRIIAKGSTHYIQVDRPDLIEKQVPLFIKQIRGTAPEPANYGSTTTE